MFSPRKKVFTPRRKLFSAEICFPPRKSLYSEEKTFFGGKKSLLRGKKSCDRKPRYKCVFVYGIFSLQQHPEKDRTAAAPSILASIICEIFP